MYIGNDYYKFTFERNPFDKAVSLYYSDHREEPRPAPEDYFDSPRGTRLLSNWFLYTIGDHIVTDFVGRFERLEEDLETIAEAVGLPEAIQLPRAKTKRRPKKTPHREFLSDQARARVELVCAKEIETFDYSW